jgi:hypothetical protein
MPWKTALRGDPLPWLLAADAEQPAVRFFALRDLLGQAKDDEELRQAQRAVMVSGPAPAILDAQYPAGYWVKPGGGYSPKYRSTVWQIIFLAELGADPADERVRRGCAYLLEHSIAANGAFSCNQKPIPSGAVPCLNGNLLYALLRLGWGDDPRVQTALAWLAGAAIGEIDYIKSGACGPEWACAINGSQPCAWGALKALKALLAVPPSQRTVKMRRAIDAGRAFLLHYNPAAADYPYTERISPTWFKLGFPLAYWSDILELAEVLVKLGCADDPQLADLWRLILEKQDAHGRWKLENALNGKMWVDIEQKGQPSKWVTLRALRVLKQMEAESHGSG